MFQPYVSTLIISGNNRKLKGRVTGRPWYVPTTKQKKAPKDSLIVFAFLFFFEIIVSAWPYMQVKQMRRRIGWAKSKLVGYKEQTIKFCFIFQVNLCLKEKKTVKLKTI